MSHLGVILGMGVGVFALRLGGLALTVAAIPPEFERALRFVPAALLTALVVAGLTGDGSGEWDRILAATVAATVVRSTGTMWTCIASGMGVYWLLQLV